MLEAERFQATVPQIELRPKADHRLIDVHWTVFRSRLLPPLHLEPHTSLGPQLGSHVAGGRAIRAEGLGVDAEFLDEQRLQVLRQVLPSMNHLALELGPFLRRSPIPDSHKARVAEKETAYSAPHRFDARAIREPDLGNRLRRRDPAVGVDHRAIPLHGGQGEVTAVPRAKALTPPVTPLDGLNDVIRCRPGRGLPTFQRDLCRNPAERYIRRQRVFLQT